MEHDEFVYYVGLSFLLLIIMAVALVATVIFLGSL